LETPMSRNQIGFSPDTAKSEKPHRKLDQKAVRPVNVPTHYAKSYVDFSTRIFSKLTAFNLIEWFIQRNGINMNNVKIVIS
jgi:hypothetical protein